MLAASKAPPITVVVHRFIAVLLGAAGTGSMRADRSLRARGSSGLNNPVVHRGRYLEIDHTVRPRRSRSTRNGFGHFVAFVVDSETKNTFYAGAPTRYFSPVGAGSQPVGPSGTATATGAGMSGGVRNTATPRPSASGTSRPALIGAGADVTTHT